MTFSETPEKIISTYYPSIRLHSIKISEKIDITTLSTSEGEYVLKKHPKYIAPNIQYLEHIIRSCSVNNLTPEHISSKTGSIFVCDSGCIYSLQKKINALKTETDPVLIGEQIASLHKVLQNIKGSMLQNHLERTTNKKHDIDYYARMYGYHEPIKHIKTIKKNFQIIHGDIHENNILVSSDKFFFIDFDCATFFSPITDVAFAGFRLFNNDLLKIQTYIKTYNRYSNFPDIKLKDIWHSLVYTVLQRILFIRIMSDQGYTKWVDDLQNQEEYLEKILKNKSLFS